MSMRDELNRVQPVIDGLNAAIRENPLAAGLIGAGIGWLLLGGAKGLGIASAAKSAVSQAGSATATAGKAVASSLANGSSSLVSNINTAAGEVAASVTSIVPDLPVPNLDTAGEAMAHAGSAIGDRFNSATAKSREYGSAIHSSLALNLERQPLLIGAIGLAIGAGIASTFATTKVEGEWMGEQGAAVRKKLNTLKDELEDRAQQVVSDVKDEVNKQGLTPNAAKDAAAGIAGKLKTVSDSARDAATQHFAGKRI